MWKDYKIKVKDMKKETTIKKATDEVSKGFWKSAGITFLATFLIALSPALGNPELTWAGLKAGALAGVFFTAFRLGIKAVVELVIARFSK